MARPFDFGEIKLTVGGDASLAIPSPEKPSCIVLLGNFCGRSAEMRRESRIANRRPVLVDGDSFDEVFAGLGAEISMPIGGSLPVTLRFSQLGDFHPDRLFERADLFRRLREVRLHLHDPAAFAATAEELGVRPGPQTAAKPTAAATPSGIVASKFVHGRAGGLLEEIVERANGRATGGRPSRAPEALQDFVQWVTQPHLAAAPDPRQAELIGVIDRALSAQMRALLHVPAFQELEAAWRALFFLVRRMKAGPQLKLYLVDISKEELAADLNSSHDFGSSEAYRLLVEKTFGTPGSEPWALIVGNYTFGPKREDAELLGRLARMANAARAPFIAAASPRLQGCASLGDTPNPRDWRVTPDTDGAVAWSALRRLPEACAIGLALPRFLLRLPYGKKTDAIESFDFEETLGIPDHEDYLWGHPAFACAVLLAQSFSEYGWEMRPGVHAQIDGLSLHVCEQDGESALKPCAEALLTEDAAARVLENGLMPLASLKGRDAVRLVRFQSIAEPLRALAGRWGG
jgi:type VI secretion system protein ImpC